MTDRKTIRRTSTGQVRRPLDTGDEGQGARIIPLDSQDKAILHQTEFSEGTQLEDIQAALLSRPDRAELFGIRQWDLETEETLVAALADFITMVKESDATVCDIFVNVVTRLLSHEAFAANVKRAKAFGTITRD